MGWEPGCIGEVLRRREANRKTPPTSPQAREVAPCHQACRATPGGRWDQGPAEARNAAEKDYRERSADREDTVRRAPGGRFSNRSRSVTWQGWSDPVARWNLRSTQSS